MYLISTSDHDELQSLGDVNHTSLHAKAVKKLALLRTRIEAGYYGKALARLAR